MSDLPSSYHGAIVCRRPLDVTWAFENNLDLRMLSFRNEHIWEHIDVIQEFINAGGKLNLADLSYACKTSNWENSIMAMQLFSPTIFSDKNLNENSKDDNVSIEYFCPRQLLEIIIKSVDKNKAVVVKFALEYFEEKPDANDYGYLVGSFGYTRCDQNEIVEIFTMFIENNYMSANYLIYAMLKENYGAGPLYTRDVFSSNLILHFCKKYPLDVSDSKILKYCCYAGDDTFDVIKYLHEIGFDVVAGVDVSGACSKITTNVIAFLVDLGLVLDQHVDSVVWQMSIDARECETDSVTTEKFDWFMDYNWTNRELFLSKLKNTLNSRLRVIPKYITDKLDAK
jgi:hypothetical protein